MTGRCARCGRVGVLVDWPAARVVLSFGTAAAWAMGWRACRACVEEIRAAVEAIPTC